MKRKSNKHLWWITILACLLAMFLIAWSAGGANAATPQGDWQQAESFAELCQQRGNENQFYLVLSGAETLTGEAPCLGKWSLESQTVLVLDQGTWEQLREVSNQGGTVFLTPSAIEATPEPTAEPTAEPTEEPTEQPTEQPIKIEDTPPADFYAGGVAWVLTAPYTLTIEGIIPEGKWGVEINTVETIVETVGQVQSVLNGRSATLWFYPIEVEKPIFVSPPAGFFDGEIPWVVPAQANLNITETIPAGRFTVTVELQDFPASTVTEVMTVLAGRAGTLWFNPAPAPIPSTPPVGFFDGGIPWPFSIMSPLPEVITATRPGLFSIEMPNEGVAETREWNAVKDTTFGKEGTLWYTADPITTHMPALYYQVSSLETFPQNFCEGGFPWFIKLGSNLPKESPCGSGLWIIHLNLQQTSVQEWNKVVEFRVKEEATLWFTPEQ